MLFYSTCTTEAFLSEVGQEILADGSPHANISLPVSSVDFYFRASLEGESDLFHTLGGVSENAFRLLYAVARKSDAPQFIKHFPEFLACFIQRVRADDNVFVPYVRVEVGES